MAEKERYEGQEPENETGKKPGMTMDQDGAIIADEAAGEQEEEDTSEEADTEEAGPDPADPEEDDGPGEDTSDDSGEGSEDKEPKGFFHRRKKEDKEKAALKTRVAELEDRSLRQLAEFENFRKRTEKEKEQRFSMGEKSVIEKILPVIDNFERGLASMPEEERGTPFASGMEMIYKQLMKQLEDLGVQPIEAVGQPFDPNFHNAVMQVESEEYESGTVAQEFQKGYTYHDTVVRYSMVGVVA